MKSLALVALALMSWTASARPSSRWIESSHTYLLPPEVSRPLSATTDFPLFWWNFLVLEVRDPVNSFQAMDQFCAQLNKAGQGFVLKMACGQDLGQFREVLGDWARDQVQREPPPTLINLRRAFDQGLTRASLPLDPMMLQVLRLDPLSSYKKLQKRLEENSHLRLETHFGYFFDPETRRLVVPMQFSFPPEESAKTTQFLKTVQELLAPYQGELKYLGTIGPQASTQENEAQIYSDVRMISILGAVLLLVQILAAIRIGRWRLLLLAPPVLISTAISAVLTCLIFGRIHGLTLAFGPGIVGLAMDHGLHSCLNRQWKGAWKANWYGLLTTVVALVAMLFSSIPFLRQLMAFSIMGLFLGFGAYWFLHRRYPAVFEVEPLPIEPTPSPGKLALIGLCFVGFVLGAVFLRPNFSLQQMNYQTREEAALTRWFFEHLKSQSPLLQIYDGPSPWPKAAAQNTFALSHKIELEGVGSFLPAEAEQAAHWRGWRELLCDPRPFSLNEQKFFAPFLALVDCTAALGPPALPSAVTSSYLKDFSSRGSWVSLWITKDAGEVQAVKAEFPEAVSLPEIVNLFPVLVAREAAWMAALAILMASALLWIYYRDRYLVMLSLVPFFTGVGLFSLVALIFQFQISFISLIALVMIFGLSLDYGIFAANLYTGRLGPSPKGVWTSVVLAALVTFLGFLPLAFCHHPVLVQLGQALVWGTLGTILGSMWGVPCCHQVLQRWGYAKTE